MRTKKYDPNFASAVTSMAFSLNLSRNMIMKLVLVRNEAFAVDLWRMAGLADAVVESGHALQRRGLVYSPDKTRPGILKLTEAGEHVFALLEIAGLTKATSRALAEREAA